MADSYSGLRGDSERLARKAAQATRRQAARAAQAQLDLAKAKEYGQTRPLREQNDLERDALGDSPSSPASARRARGREARAGLAIFERELAKVKGREAQEHAQRARTQRQPPVQRPTRLLRASPRGPRGARARCSDANEKLRRCRSVVPAQKSLAIPGVAACASHIATASITPGHRRWRRRRCTRS